MNDITLIEQGTDITLLQVPWQPASDGNKQTQTLTTAAASIVFAIPIGFKHFRILLAGRGDTAANNVDIRMRFNGDTANNYDSQIIYSQNTTVAASASAGVAGIVISAFPAASSTASYAGVASVVVPNHTGTIFYKEAIATSAVGINGTNREVRTYGGTWKNTAAITAVTLVPATGNFLAGTTATVILE